MKTTLFVLVLFATATAFGQTAAGTFVLNSQPQPIEIPSHQQTATQQPLANELNLLGSTQYLSARGERPLWEVGPKPVEISLGEVARRLRKEHEMVKRAEKCFEN